MMRLETQPKKRCARCGHPLTDKESIDRGFGPHCWEKVKQQANGYEPTPAQLRRFRAQLLLEKNHVQFCCDQCGEPTPVADLKQGKCSRCRQAPVKLEELDVELELETRLAAWLEAEGAG